MDRPRAVSTMDRPSAYKWPPAPFRRTTPPFAPSPCPTPSPLPHTSSSRRNRCLAVSAARGIPRRAAAPQEVDDQFAAVLPPLPSLLPLLASSCSSTTARSRVSRFDPQRSRREPAAAVRDPQRTPSPPPTNDATPAPTTPPPSFPDTPQPIPTLAAVQNLPEVRQSLTTVPPARWRHPI